MKNTSLSEKIDAFITYKRSLGYVYEKPELILNHFKRHMEENYTYLSLPDKDSVDSFLDCYKGQSGGLYNVIASLREFSRYLFKLGYREAYIIPPKQTMIRMQSYVRHTPFHPGAVLRQVQRRNRSWR